MTVNARQLHDYLKIKTEYGAWVRRYLGYALLDEGIDYFKVEEVSAKSDENRHTLITIPAEFKEVSEVLPLTNHAPDNGMTVNGRQLHQAVQISTYYTTWIQRAIEQAELVEGKDYFSASTAKSELSTLEVRNHGGRDYLDFYFTVPAAKEVVLMSRSPLGKLTRRYLIWCEDAFRNGVKAPVEPLKAFAATQAVTSVDLFKGMLTMFETQAVVIVQTDDWLYSSESMRSNWRGLYLFESNCSPTPRSDLCKLRGGAIM